MPEPLFDARFLRKLDRLELQTARILGGQIKGERRSKRKGISIDFADYRHYVRGDDLRFIDWNIYGRLDRLFIKLFYEEQDLQCRILLDTSRSMDFGEPNKFDFARRLAASIAYVGLHGSDQIGITCFNQGTTEVFRPSRGRHHVKRMLDFLVKLEPDRATSLYKMVREFTQRVRGRCVVVLISDFLDPAGFEGAMRYLLRDTIDVFAVQVLAPQEIEPDLGGHIELHDLETDHKVELTVNKRLKEIYMRNVEAFCASIRNYCTKYGMHYSLARSDAAIEEMMMKRLRANGLIKA
jgi:uncharacterized protein (DUF58 family)